MDTKNMFDKLLSCVGDNGKEVNFLLDFYNLLSEEEQLVFAQSLCENVKDSYVLTDFLEEYWENEESREVIAAEVLARNASGPVLVGATVAVNHDELKHSLVSKAAEITGISVEGKTPEELERIFSSFDLYQKELGE